MVELSIGQAVVAFVAAMGIPGAITGFLIWNFERRITAREKEKEQAEADRKKQAAEREKNREELEYMIIVSNGAAIALSEATARAVQRIPDAHCNGDMHAALEYATQVKHQQKEFLTRRGIQSIVN